MKYATTLLLAPLVVMSADAAETDPVRLAIVNCFQGAFAAGNFTWRDEGKSAVRLLNACQSQTKAWVSQCVAGGIDAKGCSQNALIFAQASIVMMEQAKSQEK